MRRPLVTILATLALCAGGTAAYAQALAAAALKAQEPTAGPTEDDYRIGPQDTLEINVFQLTDLNRTVKVDSGGRILLPLLGQVPASGRTSTELSTEIATRLQKSYVNNPQVTVVVNRRNRAWPATTSGTGSDRR